MKNSFKINLKIEQKFVKNVINNIQLFRIAIMIDYFILNFFFNDGKVE